MRSNSAIRGVEQLFSYRFVRCLKGTESRKAPVKVWDTFRSKLLFAPIRADRSLHRTIPSAAGWDRRSHMNDTGHNDRGPDLQFGFSLSISRANVFYSTGTLVFQTRACYLRWPQKQVGGAKTGSALVFIYCSYLAPRLFDRQSPRHSLSGNSWLNLLGKSAGSRPGVQSGLLPASKGQGDEEGPAGSGFTATS